MDPKADNKVPLKRLGEHSLKTGLTHAKEDILYAYPAESF